MTALRTTLEVVDTPKSVSPELEDEIFVRLSFRDSETPEEAEPDLAFTMAVSAMLRMLYGLCGDLKEIIAQDAFYQAIEPPTTPEAWGLN